MPTIPYDAIAVDGYRQFVGNAALTNQRLRQYFDYCFQYAIDKVGCYPAWACVGCLRGPSAVAAFGNAPKRCPSCDSLRIFQIATFQSRAPTIGKVFENALLHLLVTKFELPAVFTPGNTRTHDIEVTSRIAIESKGSPRRLLNPDGTITALARPGLERSDTWKKAQANARNFRAHNRSAPFFIVSNAVPHDLIGYRSDDISGIFNVTLSDRLNALVSEINHSLGA